ncbi:MAG: hypothetical protein JXB30_18210 [Anaerolineae bacterium]|nr:hypothetical protein [Anaerolineae bacterium]
MSELKVEKLPDEPIVVVWLSSSVHIDSLEIYQERTHQTIELLDSMEEPVYYVYDLSEAKLNIAEIVLGANKGAGSSASSLRHPNVKEVLVVTQSNLIKLAAKGLNTEIFGFVPVSVFDTLDEALEYAHSQNAAS